MSLSGKDSSSKPEHSNVSRGFFWLGMSYICGTIFFIVSKHILNQMSHRHFMMWWYFLGLVMHAAYGLYGQQMSFRDMGQKNLRILGLYAVLDLFGTTLAFIAISMLDPSIVSFFIQIQVIFVLVLGYFFLGESLKKNEFAAALIIIIGVFVMTFKSRSIPAAGAIILLISVTAHSASYIIIRNIGGTIGVLTFARLRCVTLFILFFTVNLYIEGKIYVPELPLLLTTIFGAVFGPFLNSISVYKSLQYIPAAKVSLLRSIQPILVLIAGMIFLGTFPGKREVIGGFIIVCGTFLLAWFHASHAMNMKLPFRLFRG